MIEKGGVMLVTDYVIEYIKKNEGVTHAFVYVGGTAAPLLNSIYNSKGIDYIPTRHESNAALAACGYALASGKIGLAISMSGPGSTNMVTGVANAWLDSIPVFFLTGQVTTGTYKFDNPARQMGYQELDIISIVKSITKAAELVIDKHVIPAKLRHFILKARSGRPGSVLMDIPFDVLRMDIPEDGMNEKVNLETPPVASSEIIDVVCRMIEKSKRPLILAGGGIRTPDAHKSLREFVEKTRIPVVTSLLGKDAFPNDNFLYFGFIGAYGNRYANIAMANSDLIIAIGSRLDSRQTSTPKYFARAAKKIHVEIDRNEINNNIHVDLPIHSDLTLFLEKAVKAVPASEANKYSEWMDYFKRLKTEFDVLKDVHGPTDKLVHPKRFLQRLSIMNDKKTIYLADVGNNQMFSAQSLVIKKDQRFFTSGGLGTMGFSLPAGVGASFGAPDSQIIAIMGDGGFQMSIQELQTIVHFKCPVKIVVLNNGILGLMKIFQDENYPGAYAATVDGYSVPDIGKVAAGYGIPHKRLTSNEEADVFIPEFLNHNGPYILEVAYHPDWAGYPKLRRGLGIEHQEPTISEEKLKQFMLIPTIPGK